MVGFFNIEILREFITLPSFRGFLLGVLLVYLYLWVKKREGVKGSGLDVFFPSF